MQTSIDSDFARLHGLDADKLSLFLDLFGCVSDKQPDNFSHPLPMHPRAAPVQDCYRLRLEAAELRYNRMKGLVSASLQSQQILRVEKQSLHAALCIQSLGLGEECAATFDAMVGRAARFGAIAAEMQSLAARMESVSRENESLRHFNRVLRGEQAPLISSAPPDQRADALTIENAVQRKRITALELECTRAQTDPCLFDQDERLRECEDVFDRVLGRERLDHCVEAVPGASLEAFHPIGTCGDPACRAYARRLRGGLRKAVTAEYVRERIDRLNGLIQHSVAPLETLRAEKDGEIHALRLRICRFEQSLRMTSDEADRVELRALSSEIFEAAKELDRIRSECGGVRREYARWGVMLTNIKDAYRATSAGLDLVQRQVGWLSEERTLMENCRNQLVQERALTAAHRDEMARFRDGRMGAAFQEQRVQLGALQREAEGLRAERFVAEGEGMSAMEEVVSPVAVNDVGTTRVKKARRALSAALEVVPGLGVCVPCRCGSPVPLVQLGAHLVAVHGHTRALVCRAGCGHYVINGSRSDMEKHALSSSCRQRLAQIQGLAAGFGGI
jgi:hypothetical protein